MHEALRFLLKDDRLQDELVPLRQAYKRIRKAAEASLCVDCGARWATRKSRCSRCYSGSDEGSLPVHRGSGLHLSDVHLHGAVGVTGELVGEREPAKGRAAVDSKLSRN